MKTCHLAEGMEWDNVQVCNDFISLCQCQEKPGGQSKYPSIFFSLKRSRQPSVRWKFAFRDWGDDVNLVYVACRRASRLLSIPPGVVSVMASFDMLHQWKQQQQQQHDQQASPSVQPFQMVGCQAPLVPASAQELYWQLVEPLRVEWDLLQQHHDDQLLCDMLHGSDKPIAPSGGSVTGSKTLISPMRLSRRKGTRPRTKSLKRIKMCWYSQLPKERMETRMNPLLSFPTSLL